MLFRLCTANNYITITDKLAHIDPIFKDKEMLSLDKLIPLNYFAINIKISEQ